MKQPSAIVLAAILVLFVAACEPRGEEATQEGPDTTEAVLPALQRADTTGASLWSHLQQAQYQETWQLWPDKGTLYTGQEPHGMLLTTYLNEAAYQALTGDAAAMPDGAIIVKENYMPDSTLAAVTVMHKVSGYNTEHNDWFFAKYLPSGQLDQMNGMPLEGRVAGCQACHGQKKDNDYLFTASLQ